MTIMLAQDASGGDSIYVFWGLVLLAIAIGLFILELFVPSGGLIGLLAGAATIGAVAAFFRYDTMLGVGATIAVLVLGPIAVVGAFKWWVNSGIGKRMILGAEESEFDENPAGIAVRSEHVRAQRHQELRALIGAEGITVTALRPIGTVVIGGERIDALAQSGVIGPDMPVVVVDVYDNQIKVRPK